MQFKTFQVQRTLGVLALAATTSALVMGFGAASAHAKPVASQNVTLYVFPGNRGIKGPDGKGHDIFVPDGFVAKAGVPVHVSIVNYDDMIHSMTFDANAGFGPFVAKPGKDHGNTVIPTTTTFAFTPRKAGNFRWHCMAMCDMDASDWAMHSDVSSVTTNAAGKITGGMFSKEADRDGFMAGYVVVMP